MPMMLMKVHTMRPIKGQISFATQRPTDRSSAWPRVNCVDHHGRAFVPLTTRRKKNSMLILRDQTKTT